jgi:hypothetical protein
MLGVAAGALTAQPRQPTEYRLKAAFLYNFGKFIEWPAAAFPDSGAALVLGILGRDPFGADIDAMVQDRRLHARPLVVRRYEDLDELGPCHILFTTWLDPKLLTALFERLGEAHVLTVGESAQFTALGGVIRFYLEDQKVRFEINTVAAGRAGLAVSSRLLGLARIFGESEGP